MNVSPPAFPHEFRPDVFFIGRTEGAGVLTGPTGRLMKRCMIETFGAVDDAHGSIHFDETFSFDDGTVDRLHWAVGRDPAGALHASELSVVGRPLSAVAGASWRFRFKRLGREPFAGTTLTYDARLTQATSEVVIKETVVRLFGLPLARLTGFHRRVQTPGRAP